MDNVSKNVIIPFERYLILKAAWDKQNNVHFEKEETAPGDTFIDNAEGQSNQDNKLHSDIIIKMVPKRFQNKARTLLEFLSRLPAIQWNEKGVVSLDGHLFDQTNICDLVQFAVNSGFSSFSPTGSAEFLRILLQNNVPLSLIATKHRDGTSSLKGAGSPPGLPKNQKYRNLEKEWLW